MPRSRLMQHAPVEELASSLRRTPVGEPHARNLASRLMQDILFIDRQESHEHRTPSRVIGMMEWVCDRTSPNDDFLGLRNAIENASNRPVMDAAIIELLHGKGGISSHLRALFSDVSLAEFARVGQVHGIYLPTLLAAYERAGPTALAANSEHRQPLADN